MPERVCDQYLRPYRDAVKAHGASFYATLWSSREAQQTRFDVMIDLAGLDDGVVLDAGCGTGDFAQRLIDRRVDFKRYIGVDAVPELIEAARARGLPRCEFRMGDLIHDPKLIADAMPDFVCISGALNTMEEDAARELVRSAFAAARQGVVFNFLSNRAQPQWMSRDIGPARRFDTVKWIDWALSVTTLVGFTQEYLEGHDATILMRKE
jgi:SAM-dependent methyltransferase